MEWRSKQAPRSVLRKRPQCGCPTPYRTPGQSTRSTVRAPAPSSPIASSRRNFIRSFKSFASAQRWRLHQRGWAEPVQTAWTRCDSAIATTGGHPPASGPARSATTSSRTAQVKSNETRAGGRPCHRSAGPIHEGAMLSHARGPLKQAERKRFIFCSFFAQKKAQKPVTLRNGHAIRGSEHSTPGRRIMVWRALSPR